MSVVYETVVVHLQCCYISCLFTCLFSVGLLLKALNLIATHYVKCWQWPIKDV